MIRQNESPRRLGRPALLGVVLAAAAALPLAPTMARQDDVVEESQTAQTTSGTRQEETRTVIVRQATPTLAPDVVVNEAGVEKLARVISVDGNAVTVTGDVITQEAAGDEGKGLGADVTVAVKEPQTIEYAWSDLVGKGDAKAREHRIQQARYEVEMLAANLAVAKQRLAQLERGEKEGGHGLTVTVPRKETVRYEIARKQPNEDVWRSKVDAKSIAKESKGDSSAHTVKGDGKDGDRLDQLERKLEKIDRLLGKLLEEKGDTPKEKEKPAAYDPGHRVF